MDGSDKGDEQLGFEISDGHEKTDRDVLDRLHADMAAHAAATVPAPGLRRHDWAWLMAFLCTHPSDFAFDAVSRTLAATD